MEKREINITKNMYNKFIDKTGHEPNYVECQVTFKDDNTTEDVVITFNSNINDNDDDIFFYCYDFESFIELTSEDNNEDFFVNDVYEFY